MRPETMCSPPAKRSIAETSARRWAAFSVTTSASSSLTVTVSDMGGLLVLGVVAGADGNGRTMDMDTAGVTQMQPVLRSKEHGAGSDRGG